MCISPSDSDLRIVRHLQRALRSGVSPSRAARFVPPVKEPLEEQHRLTTGSTTVNARQSHHRLSSISAHKQRPQPHDVHSPRAFSPLAAGEPEAEPDPNDIMSAEEFYGELS